MVCRAAYGRACDAVRAAGEPACARPAGGGPRGRPAVPVAAQGALAQGQDQQRAGEGQQGDKEALPLGAVLPLQGVPAAPGGGRRARGGGRLGPPEVLVPSRRPGRGRPPPPRPPTARWRAPSPRRTGGPRPSWPRWLTAGARRRRLPGDDSRRGRASPYTTIRHAIDSVPSESASSVRRPSCRTRPLGLGRCPLTKNRSSQDERPSKWQEFGEIRTSGV